MFYSALAFDPNYDCCFYSLPIQIRTKTVQSFGFQFSAESAELEPNRRGQYL